MTISLAALAVISVLFLCVIQKTKSRQDAAFVYVVFTGLHFICFDGRFDDSPLWPLYYFTAGLFCLGIIWKLQRLESYTRFHLRLQLIAFVSMIVNFLGGAIQYGGGNLTIYDSMGAALYLILIVELLKDGRHIRISREDGLFYRIRRFTI